MGQCSSKPAAAAAPPPPQPAATAHAPVAKKSRAAVSNGTAANAGSNGSDGGGGGGSSTFETLNRPESNGEGSSQRLDPRVLLRDASRRRSKASFLVEKHATKEYKKLRDEAKAEAEMKESAATRVSVDWESSDGTGSEGGSLPSEAVSSSSGHRQGMMDANDRSSLMVDELIQECRRVVDVLDQEYGAGTGFARAGDAVVVMEGWNKALAFKTMWSEAMTMRWRVLVAREQLWRDREEREKEERMGGWSTQLAMGEEKKNEEAGAAASSSSLPAEEEEEENAAAKARADQMLHRRALDLVETGKDPLASALESRVHHFRDILVAMVDCAVRSLCPHTQRVQREAYRPINDDLRLGRDRGDNDEGGGGGGDLRRFALLEGTMDEYCRLFARCGVLPWHWTLFCDAFLWTMRTHSPYADETDSEDMSLPRSQCAHSAFAAAYVAKPAVAAVSKMMTELDSPMYRVGIRRFWGRISEGEAAKAAIGETFYRQLLTNHPELLDYFAKADMDSLALHLVLLLDLLVKSSAQIGTAETGFRRVLEHLGDMHRKLGIPTFAFPVVGGQLLKTLKPLLEEEETVTKDMDMPCRADELEHAFAVLYMEVMAVVFYPMVQEEKLVNDAETFFDTVAKELQWSPDQLSRRLLEVKLEIQSTGTYVHTSEELELGARLAWRNSAKCIGRIAWNTLMVRDCRHVESPPQVFKEVEEHLRLATCGTNIQSVMTVFKPKSKAEAWGMRFWNSQFVRYAAYKNEDGTVTGDPANLEFTEFVVRNGWWTPPEKRTDFDVLPLFLKLPGIHKPFVYQLPKNCVHEVVIEHPTCPAIKDLGLRWAAVPAISNFNINLGGVDYQCVPFNGWFVSIEVVRNLMERYKVNDRWADAMGLDKSEKMIEMRIQHEVQVAVLHSFSSQGFTMVDPVMVGNSFMVHCKRERDQGRECPGQWSWIGGLVGPTNVTWHREMRDFELKPQYDYCCEPWMVTEVPACACSGGAVSLKCPDTEEDEISVVEDAKLPRVLILFGSETGTAEAAANRMGAALRLLKPTIKSLDSVAGLEIVKSMHKTHIIAFCSTFNRGEFPSNASEFAKTTIPDGLLANKKVAVLALGSSLYPDFCKAGVDLDKMLAKAGGQPLVQMTKVDDATGSEGPIADWLALVRRLVMPKHMEAMLLARAGAASSPPEHRLRWSRLEKSTSEGIPRYVRQDAGTAHCLENVELMAKGGDIDVRSTRKITFQLPEKTTYETGDHLAVHPLNSLDMVERFSQCFSEELMECAAASGACPVLEEGEAAVIAWQLQQPFSIDTIDNGESHPAQLSFQTPATLADVLQAHVDLSLKSSTVGDLLVLLKGLLEDLPDNLSTVNSGKKAQLIKSHWQVIECTATTKKAAVDEFLDHYPTVVDFLEYSRSLLCTKCIFGEKNRGPLLSLAQLLVFLPRLQARYYSISSSPISDPSKVSIAVGVLHVQTPSGIKLHGVCSNYLARIRPNQDKVLISVRKSTFRGPKDVSSPVIMVGAGTGLAPMMGFLADREHAIDSKTDKKDVSECHLFFGCRTEDDRIYSETIDKWQEGGILQHHLALSRVSYMPKTYVQDLLEQFGAELCRLLMQKDTYYYICGDAKVADYCFESCVGALRRYGNMSRVAAVQHIKMMRAQGRWQYDLWGIIKHFNEVKLELRRKKQANAKSWLLNFAH